jgi:hypothetical protein
MEFFAAQPARSTELARLEENGAVFSTAQFRQPARFGSSALSR